MKKSDHRKLKVRFTKIRSFVVNKYISQYLISIFRVEKVVIILCVIFQILLVNNTEIVVCFLKALMVFEITSLIG